LQVWLRTAVQLDDTAWKPNTKPRKSLNWKRSVELFLSKPDEPEPNVGRALPDMVGRAHPTVSLKNACHFLTSFDW
jgi:hypothetical protein